MTEEEDDYMSDAVLQQCHDTRPGLIPARIQRAIEQEKKSKEAKEKNKTKPKHVLEKEKRDEGLGKAIGSDNKGFAMLQKMGFKPGMTLGKHGTGRSEPVPVNVKLNRGGLGRETEIKQRQARQTANQIARSARRHHEDTLRKRTFQQHLSDRFSDQRAERDLNKSQKVCEQLDSQKDIKCPAESFFWPKFMIPTKKRRKDPEEGESKEGYAYYVSEEESEEEDEEDEEEESLEPEISNTEKLEVLTLYLRNNYKYCVWCGTAYEDRSDMEANCPGNTAEAHDD